MVITDWKMDFSKYKGLSCTAPCNMYSVLENHKIIDDPYYGLNEEKLTKLSEEDCTFYTQLYLDEGQLQYEKIDLVFHGLDTICDIYFNGSLLDSVMNMHRTYSYDIKALAKENNEIRLEFKSPIKYFERMEAEHHLYTNWDTVQGAAHLRKALYMSGWDWAPKLPDMGIFRPVEIKCYNTDIIEDVSILQYHKDGKVTLNVSATTKHNANNLTLLCEIDGQKATLENGKAEITIDDPRLWWPNGYGAQELYDITFRLYNGSCPLDTAVKSIGLRTLELCREDDEHGQEFCFRVNGIKIFAMGANYVPMDNLISRDTDERLEGLIKDCIFANFNCIRVWGGAYYPSDYFYDLCDRYGLIVWQDLMVACSNVWLSENMEEQFILEATQNVKRIRHHASLGIICGNNEMEEAICNWPCADGSDPLVRQDYLKLYEDIFPSLCSKLAPQIAYTPSSPTSGGGFDNPTDFTRGDVHFWHVWNGDCPLEEYRKYKFRFCSEYGFESLPSMKTVEFYCPKEEQELLSRTMVSHQKHYGGNPKILRYLQVFYKTPKDLKSTVYVSQLNQANAIKYGVEHFRRHRGYTMGSIYWQLNDPWPVASWSSIDYFGRYKALHYFAKRFYQKVAIGLFNENGKITVNIANEGLDSFEGKIKAGVVKNDLSVISTYEKEVSVNALFSLDALTVSNEDFDGHSDRIFFAELYDKDGNLISRNTELGTAPKDFDFKKPSIKIDAKRENDTIYLSFSADVVTKGVFVDFKNYDLALSDNFFDLYSSEPYTVSVKTDLTEEEILSELQITNLYDAQ